MTTMIIYGLCFAASLIAADSRIAHIHDVRLVDQVVGQVVDQAAGNDNKNTANCCCDKCCCDKCNCDKAVSQIAKPLDWQRSLVEGKPREGFFGGVLDFFAAAGNFFLGTLNFYRAFASWLNFAWVLPASIFCGFVANGLLIAHAIKGAKS